MADNVAITAGAGTTIGTDDVGGVHFQKVKLDVGADGVSIQPAGSIPVYIVSGTITGALPAGSANIGDVDVLSSALPTGAATAALQLPDGHNVTVDNAAGASAVNIQDGGNAITVDGTVNIGTFPDNEPFNIAQIGGTAVVTGGVAGSVGIGGNTAHDAVAPANPVVVGAQMETIDDSAPGTRASADGDAAKLATTDGALFVITTGPQSWSTVNLGLLTAATVKAAPGAGLSLYVTGLVFSIGAATASTIKITISGGADIFGPHYLEAINGRGLAIVFPTPLKVTANTALLATSTGSTTATLNIQGFTAAG